jgi:hypothetical protein
VPSAPGAIGIPPPPPPPPPPPGAPGAPPPPPPPGGGPSSTIPKKPNPAPPEKTRPVYWNRLADAPAQNTFWKTIDESSVIVSQENILRYFRAADRVVVERQIVNATDTSPVKTVKLSLLSSERSKQLIIMLSRFRRPPPEIVGRVRSLDPELTEDLVNALLSAMPPDEEIGAARAFDGDVSRLSDADLFVREVANCPNFRDFCELMYLQRTARSAVEEVLTPVRTIVEATRQVRESPALRYILQLVLRIGNVLNGGGSRGGAYGFKVGSLAKLGDARAAVPGMTLLTFVVQSVEAKNPTALALSSELAAVPRASELELDGIRNLFSPLRAKFEVLKKKAASVHMPQEYIAAGQQLVSELSGTFADASALLQRATEDTTALLQTFFEDPAMTKPADFFGGLAKFIKQFDAEKAAIDQRREEEERKARSPQAPRAGKGRGPVDFKAQQRGVMDDLLAKIRTGQLKRTE